MTVMVISIPGMTTAPSAPTIVIILVLSCDGTVSTSVGCGHVEFRVVILVYMYNVCARDVLSVFGGALVFSDESVEYGFIITVVVNISSLCVVVGFIEAPLGAMTVDRLTKNAVFLLRLRVGLMNAVVINSSHAVDFIEGLMGMINWPSGTVNQF